MQAFTVRSAVVTDLPQLSCLWLDRAHVHQQMDRRLQVAPEGRRRWEQAAAVWLTDPDYRMLVGEDDGVCLGYLVACLQPSPPGLLPEQVGCITEMALDQHRYSGGLARALLRTARAWFAEQGILHVVARLQFGQVVEQAFWHAHGAQSWMEWVWLKS